MQADTVDRLRKQLVTALNQVDANKQKYETEISEANDSHQNAILALRNTLQTAQDNLANQGKANLELKRETDHQRQVLEAQLHASNTKWDIECRTHSERVSALERELVVSVSSQIHELKSDLKSKLRLFS